MAWRVDLDAAHRHARRRPDRHDAAPAAAARTSALDRAHPRPLARKPEHRFLGIGGPGHAPVFRGTRRAPVRPEHLAPTGHAIDRRLVAEAAEQFDHRVDQPTIRVRELAALAIRRDGPVGIHQPAHQLEPLRAARPHVRERHMLVVEHVELAQPRHEARSEAFRNRRAIRMPHPECRVDHHIGNPALAPPRQPEFGLHTAVTQMLDDLGVVLVYRYMVHDRRAVPEPEPEHIRVQDQILLRHVHRVATVDGMAPALAPRPDRHAPGHLRRGQRSRDGSVVREVPNRPAMIAIRDDPLSVIEDHLETGAVGEDRRQALDPTDAPAFVVEQIAGRDFAHGRPAEGRRHGRIQSQRGANLRGLLEHHPLGWVTRRERIHDRAHVGRALGAIAARFGRGTRSQSAMAIRPLRDRQVGIGPDAAPPGPKNPVRPVEFLRAVIRASAGRRRGCRVGRGHGFRAVSGSARP